MANASVGGAINNCVHMAQHGGKTRLLVCNNDETIKVFDLPSMEQVVTLRLNTAVNGGMARRCRPGKERLANVLDMRAVSVSPDGTKMVAVGDSNQVFIYNITSGGEYQQVAVLNTTKDAGFSCSWDQASMKFAVGCQDGFVCVWDMRRSKMLARLNSVQSGSRGAVRAVKFSHSSSVDLLAFTEVP